MKLLFSTGMGVEQTKPEQQLGARVYKMGALPSSRSQRAFNLKRDDLIKNGTLNLFTQCPERTERKRVESIRVTNATSFLNFMVE